MKVPALPLLLTATLGFGIVCGQTVQRKIPGEHLRIAQDLERQGSYLEAVKAYREVLQLEAANDQAAMSLSKLLYKLGVYEESLDVLRQLLRARPELLRVRLDLAYLLQLQARFLESKEEAQLVLNNLKQKKAREDEPLRVYALHILGRDLLGEKRYQEAQRELLEVVRLNPGHVEAHLNLAELFSQNEENYQMAVLHFKKVLDLKPDLAIAHRKFGKTLLDLGQTDLAKQHLERSAQLEPNQPETYFLLAAAYRKEGNVEKIQEWLSRFQTLEGKKQDVDKNRLKARSLSIEGEEQLSRHDLTKAAEAFQRALELAPDSHDAYFGLAKVHLERNEPQEALREIGKALELHPFDAMYHYFAAVCLDELGRPADALQAISKAITLNPALAQFHNLLANILCKKERYPQAITSYQKAIELDSRDPSYHLNLSVAFAKAGLLKESGEAKERYRKLLAK